MSQSFFVCFVGIMIHSLSACATDERTLERRKRRSSKDKHIALPFRKSLHAKQYASCFRTQVMSRPHAGCQVTTELCLKRGLTVRDVTRPPHLMYSRFLSASKV
ncbi:hypothetical protein F4804DRAFT_306249 [Jackrogersella minutella]|nr:hypothetical protein F4804DRAFT_306249 [Jackrogersella minutella]